jgi:hypothetical protein
MCRNPNAAKHESRAAKGQQQVTQVDQPVEPIHLAGGGMVGYREFHIVCLQAGLDNQWSAIAARIPDRIDNWLRTPKPFENDELAKVLSLQRQTKQQIPVQHP